MLQRSLSNKFKDTQNPSVNIHKRKNSVKMSQWIRSSKVNFWWKGDHLLIGSHKFFKSSPKYIFIYLTERGKERERKRQRNIDVREKHPLVASCTHPDWIGDMPWAGIEPVISWWTGGWSNQLSHLARVGQVIIFLKFESLLTGPLELKVDRK